MLFAQVPGEAGPDTPDISEYAYHPRLPWYLYLFDPLHSPIVWLGGLFMIWMLVHCIRRDPERNLWFWIIVMVYPGLPLGAMLYFFLRWLPERNMATPAFAKRWTRGRELQQLEAAARRIGNPHQFFLWGEALRDVGNHAQARRAYDQALVKDPINLPALWGAALADLALKDCVAAQQRLEKILAIDPAYKFGDVSLAYGRTLVALNSKDLAQAHMEKHLLRWKQPEAYYLYAALLVERGEGTLARTQLESMLLDLSGSPSFFSRQNRSWAGKGKRLLNRLSREKAVTD